MCGISGKLNINYKEDKDIKRHILVMNKLQAHRGPDGEGFWENKEKFIGFGHRRLSIIDIETGNQPMTDVYNNTICFNGEIYNFLELKKELRSSYNFKTNSDTEVILACYKKWGTKCLNRLRGMFAFAIWDEDKKTLFCARDKFGIKPFYYFIDKNNFYFSSEAKALLPFVNRIQTDYNALKDYFVFQFVLEEKTLFKGVKQLLPAHFLIVKEGKILIKKYWEVNYDLDWQHNKKYFKDRVIQLLEDSVKIHLRSDVPVGAYLSGGIDSSIIASLASKFQPKRKVKVFNGRFAESKEYDESKE